jgi:hypothetical protein
MPDADRLGRDTELAGDLSLTDTGGDSSAARSRRAWSRSCSRCAAGGEAQLACTGILVRPAAELQLDLASSLNPTPKILYR